MKDRVPLYPGRVSLIPVSGEENVFDMVRADEPQQDGTPINKQTLLTDEVASLFGFGENAVPNDVFARLSDLLLFETLGAKIVHGTYTGSGAYGSANPTTLNVGFKPLFFGVVLGDQKIYGTWGVRGALSYSDTTVVWSTNAANASLNPDADVSVNWGDTYVQWYSDSVLHQMSQATTYSYVVIGV